ncbi:hypothetical protein PILCRDRAFT_169800 [Piloderma croceum F 1598]|uniref:Uncharacterized protein n=1 Tax=Piloderma croceum (strain F 1598) TaxID=765440 RepID=A0A0C3CNE6_PILCF|nr:hypothetical protein PILCRDRAFT_169800 [Piloderma croceum F 1598]
MIPLLLTFALALVSFTSSAFVILRVIIPVLPPSRFSRRVPPSEFGLRNAHSLSPADKSHLWLAGCDLLALVVFVWQALQESLGGPSDFAEAGDPGSAVRLWLVMTVRQTCLLVVASIALLHVRMGRSVSLGSKHWILWAPTLLLTISSTAFSGVLAGAGAKTLFSGIIGYSMAVAIITSVAFGWLVVTLVMIKRNLAALNESADSWPPVEVENKAHPPFAEEIDAVRDGSSWITSDAGSYHESISNWSFSSHKHQASHHVSPRANPENASHRFMSSVTPCNDPNPFKREASQHPRVRSSSRGSWLTSPSASQETLSQWSYSTTRPNASAPDLHADILPSAPRLRPSSPPLANAQVLGGYNAGHAPGNADTEKGLASLAVTNDSVIDVSLYRAIGWLIVIWVPLGLALPYFFFISPSGSVTPLAARVLLVMSVTISSPLLALNLLLRSPMPIPAGLFETRKGPNATTPASRFKHGSLDNYARECKRSGSITVVEGRRSGDIWLSNGDAVVNKNKFGRTMEMLTPAPKLSILPPEESHEDHKYTSPLVTQIDDAPCLGAPAPNRAVLRRTKSLDLSHYSASNESLACTTKILIARKHFSTPAQTIMVPASERQPGILDPPGAAIDKPSNGHLRARSISSAMRLSSMGFTVKNARLAKMGHRKSLSSDALPLKVIDDINEIDAMTAGLLPRLVPGLKVGRRMKIRDSIMPTDMFTEKELSPEFRVLGASEALSSPELHSTPARKEEAQPGKISEHNRNHYGSLWYVYTKLPYHRMLIYFVNSLGLGKDGDQSLAMWKADVNRTFESQVSECAIVSNDGLVQRAVGQLREVDERADIQSESPSHFGHAYSIRPLGRCISASSSHESVATLLSNAIPPSAASTMTLFDFEAGLGPQAESTPLEGQKKKHPTSKKAPPRNRLPTPHVRRSSNVYTKSDNDPSANPGTSSRSFSRAVRQLVPKRRSILQRTASSDSKPGSPGGVLRPLSLLQDCDTNRQVTTPGGARPLSLGKRREQLKISNDENDAPPLVVSPRRWSFRQLQLARSETSKQQEVLRASEKLSDVDTGSLSTAEQVYGYAL